jgi:type II secretory ATPase GspE/PulE/Tfp pilus assembly ATPase PilB-like protein
MGDQDTVPTHLRKALDGYDIERGFGRVCPSCKREYEPNERLFVIAERSPDTAEWRVASVVCTECGHESLSDDERRDGIEQALLSVEVAVAGMTLVLDGERARLLDRSPAAAV